MTKKHIFDINYDEWLAYYNTKCDYECNNKKYCPFKVGACCLGDILSKDDKRNLNEILNDIDGIMVEVKE